MQSARETTASIGHGELRPGEAVGLSDGAQAVARGLRRPSLSPSLVGAIAFALDTIALSLGLWFASFASEPHHFAPLATAGSAVALGVCVSLAGWLLGFYRLRRLRRYAQGVIRLLCLAVPVAITGGIDLGPIFLVAPFVLASRGLAAVIAAAAIDFGLTERRAVIVGGGERGGTGHEGCSRPQERTSGSAESSTTATTGARRQSSAACQSSEALPTLVDLRARRRDRHADRRLAAQRRLGESGRCSRRWRYCRSMCGSPTSREFRNSRRRRSAPRPRTASSMSCRALCGSGSEWGSGRSKLSRRASLSCCSLRS